VIPYILYRPSSLQIPITKVAQRHYTMFQAIPQQQYPIHQSPSPIASMSTLPQNTMITSNPAEQKPRKLRASCDACSRAKVRELNPLLEAKSDSINRSSVTK